MKRRAILVPTLALAAAVRRRRINGRSCVGQAPSRPRALPCSAGTTFTREQQGSVLVSRRSPRNDTNKESYRMVNKLSDIITRGVSAVCGLGVYLNEEGWVACSGCKLPTDNCTNPPVKG